MPATNSTTKKTAISLLILASLGTIGLTATTAETVKQTTTAPKEASNEDVVEPVLPKPIAIEKKELVTVEPLTIVNLPLINRASTETLIEAVTASNSRLNSTTVFNLTNQERLTFGLKPLERDPALDQAARIKLDDMFENQYFDHFAPDGTMGAGEVSQLAGYEYLLVGENLAWGGFRDSRHLVESWMNSPGHRDNILKTDFKEIGLAVGRGEYQGRTSWMAVQIFARPLSDCPAPTLELRDQIEGQKNQLNRYQQQLTEKLEIIDSTEPKTGPGYETLIEEYNRLVDQHNLLAEETESLTEHYNLQVSNFNNCIETTN